MANSRKKSRKKTKRIWKQAFGIKNNSPSKNQKCKNKKKKTK